MLQFMVKRLLLAIPVLLGVSVIVFLIMRLLPGDVAQMLLSDWGATPQQIAELRQQLGLNDPLYVQYYHFLINALRGDFGESVTTGRPVMPEILNNVQSSIVLTLAAMAVAITIGLFSGIFAALHQNRWPDGVSMLVALIGVSMPSFWLGLTLIYIFSLKLGWFPATGVGGIQRLVLPAIALGVAAAATIARLVRSSMLEALQQEYIVTARAKGLSERIVVLRHALRNAVIPVLTIVGLQFGYLLGGTVIIETVFSRPGLGRLTIDAILAKDFTMVQGTIMFIAAVYVLVNTVVDLCYGLLDPRIRHGAG